MSKVIVPQEQQEKIIDLYVNKQYGRMKIKKELNLPFGDTVIKRILQENGIHIRNFNEAKVGCYKMEVPEELQKQIIELYERGYGLDKIVEILNTSFSFDKVKSILIDNGIHIRNTQEAAQTKIIPDLRKYQINDNYNFNSHNGAWILGMFAADGYLPSTKGAHNKCILALKESDVECLEQIKKELSYTGPIYNYLSSDQIHRFVSLSFTSKKIRETMESYGIINKKTYFMEHLPDLPDEYMLDYIRGYFDGDGSIYITKKDNKIGSSFTCHSKTFLYELKEYLQRKIGISGKIYFSRNNYSLVFFKKDTIVLCNALYQNDYLSLKRKKQKFFKIKKELSNS